MARRSAAVPASDEPQTTPATPAPTDSDGEATPAGESGLLASLRADPDPFASAFEPPAPPRRPKAADAPTDNTPPDEPATPAPTTDGEATPAEATDASDPFAGKTDAQIAHMVRSNPRLKAQADLYTQERIRTVDAENNRLRNRQAEAAVISEMAAAYHDPTAPKHWDALDYWAARGIAPVQQSATEAQLFGDEGFRQRFMAHHRDAFEQEAVQAAIYSAADHPEIGKLGPQRLEALWQESETPAQFYERAVTERLKAKGWLPPNEVEALREATGAAERTRLFGEEYPVPDVSRSEGGGAGTWRIPADKALIDPDALLQEEFTLSARNGRRAS